MSLLLDKILQSNILLPFVTFALGVIFTFAVTSVNHKRIHCDDIRKTIFDAVLNVKNCASEYWLSEYDTQKHAYFIGSLLLFKSIIPLSHDMMNKNQILEMEKVLQEFILDLMDTEEMTKEYHRISSNQVIQIHKNSGFFLKQYYSIYLEQTRITRLTIYPRWVQNLWIWIKNPQFKNGGA